MSRMITLENRQRATGTITGSGFVATCLSHASLARWLRPSLLAPYAVSAPLAVLMLGAVAPAVADGAQMLLGPAVFALVFAGLAATDTSPPTRHEAGRALLMLVATALVCPAIVAVLAAATQLPGDLAMAAVLVAASPVAVSAGVVSRRFGLPERAPVWAALGGLAVGPMLVPAIAAAIVMAWGTSDLTPAGLSPLALAERAALLSALPAAAAIALRRATPVAAAALAPEFRGIVVAALMVLALCAGGTASSTLQTLGVPDGSAVLGLAAAAISVSAGTAWAVGRFTPVGHDASALGRSLLVTGVVRNASFVWAAAATCLTARGEAVLALAVVAAFTLPAATLATGMLRKRRRADEPRPGLT